MLQSSSEKLNGIAASIVALECYDEFFGLYDTSSQVNSPYALVAMHDAESLDCVDAFETELMRFAEAGVAKVFRMSFSEFMQLPKHRCDKIIEICTQISKKDAEQITETEQRIKAMGAHQAKRTPPNP